MSLTKLSAVGLHLARKNLLLRRFPVHESKTQLRFQHTKSGGSRKNDDDDDEIDKPIQYTTSKASQWDPVYSRTGVNIDDRPWFQGWVVMASTAVFLIYFCILREENDIDEKLTWDLKDHFHGEQRENLEKSQKLSMELSEDILRKR